MTRNPVFVEIFIQALRDPEKAVRAQATHALAGMGELASERLITLLHDPDWKVRYRAAEALGMMNEKKAVRPLIALLSDEKDHVRYSAVQALGNMEAKESLEYLLNIDDPNPYVMRMTESVITQFKADPRIS
jgi:HEAT repeat protein